MRALEERLNEAWDPRERAPLRVSLAPPRRIAAFRASVGAPLPEERDERRRVLAVYADALRAQPWCSKVVVVEPSIYFDLTDDALAGFIASDLARLEPSGSPEADDAVWNLSCCSPNANKPLHMGHARNIAIGGALERILESAGRRVAVTCSFSDYGLHVARAVAAHVHARGAPELPSGIKSDHYVGQLYAEGCRLAATGAPDAAGFDHATRQLLRAYLDGDRATADAFARVTGWAVDGIRATFTRFGASFDRFLWESELRGLGREILTEGLAQSRIERRADGSLWVAGLPEDLGAILVREDGSPLYLLQMLAASLQRTRMFGASLRHYVSIRAIEQSAHFELTLAAWNALGYAPLPGRRIVAYGLVYDGDERIKSRIGGALLIDDVLDQLETRLRAWQPGRSEASVRALAVGTLRLFCLSHALDKSVHFDWNDLLRGRGALYARVDRVTATARRAVTSASVAPSPAARSALMHELARIPEVHARCVAALDPTDLALALRRICDVAEGYFGRGRAPVGFAEDARLVEQTLARIVGWLALPPIVDEAVGGDDAL